MRVLALVRKEFLHLMRDRRTLAVMFMMPVVQLMLLGYAATTNVDHLRTVVVDFDKTAASRALVDAYRASRYFDISTYADSVDEMGELIDHGSASAGLVIPAGYGADVARGQATQVSFIIDGSDPRVATTVYSASQSVGQAHSVSLMQERTGYDPSAMLALEVLPRVWYNPEMDSANFMVPGLLGTVLFFLTALFTAMAIVREREQGTIEQLLVTPIKPLELVVGKIAPYILVAFINVIEVLSLAVYWFGVPIHGSVGLLLALAAMFLLTSLGIGMFISSVAHSQQEAMLLTFLILFPSIFLGGFFFPLAAMPSWLQAITYIVPLRYMLVVIRGIVLKGVGLEALRNQVLPLLVFGVSILVLAATRLRRTLE